ncbi:MAG: malonate transporter subunit MadL [Verrucomicrobiaceae bacterium]|nr:MAG: malonate transporter subunit MadL [Verrucomicrobiaceae bacterium]
MAIYGTALLSLCLLVGLVVGKALGWLLGMDANVGGVGIAMLLLVVVTDRMRREDALPAATDGGVMFWSAIYIPVIVAMAASQNVRAAIHGGPAALMAGVLSVIGCILLVPVFNKIGRKEDDPQS